MPIGVLNTSGGRKSHNQSTKIDTDLLRAGVLAAIIIIGVAVIAVGSAAHEAVLGGAGAAARPVPVAVTLAQARLLLVAVRVIPPPLPRVPVQSGKALAQCHS